MAGMTNAHALVVGIANYWNTSRYLRTLPQVVIKDARDVHSLLVDPERAGYRREDAQLLLNEGATLEGLRAALMGLARRCNPESVVFIYVSSHGAQVTSTGDVREYLLPVDVACADNGRLRPDTALSGDEFSEALAAIPARRVLVILDCCHSGGIGEIKGPDESSALAGLPESYYEKLKSGRGRVIIAAAREDESSWIMPGDANSLFTKHLLAGMAGGVASPYGFAHVFDVFEYLQPRVTGEQPRQHPIFQSRVEENFPIALFLGGRRNAERPADGEFLYDAYVSYLDQEPDSTWVWDVLMPRFKQAGLRVVVSGDSETPGVARVVNIERGVRAAKRTVVILSDAYLANSMTEFENTLAQTMGIQEGSYRLLPIAIGPLDQNKLPARLSMLTSLRLDHPARSEREMTRLITSLRGPLPRR